MSEFLSESEGFVAGGSDQAIERSHGVILRTVDGGLTWKRVYESTRPFEMIWKFTFPENGRTAYATIMHYDEKREAQLVAKSSDRGLSWLELLLTSNARARELGVAFLNDAVGWVGTGVGGFQTVDGGLHWEPVDIGEIVNKIRIVPTPTSGFSAWAVGRNVYRLGVPRKQ